MTSEQTKAEAFVREKLGLKIPEALPLPVRYDGMNYYWGENNQIVGDIVPDYDGGEFFRIRGWGRIQYLKVDGKTPEELQEEVAYWIADAINAYSQLSLQHWLRVLRGCHYVEMYTASDEIFRHCCWEEDKEYVIDFNLTTGQPATEADYRAFNEICN